MRTSITWNSNCSSIDIETADDETLNSIFRCAHSVKGGAATFGFKDVAELTHQMETLLDKLRRHELAPDRGMVDVLLQSGDALRAQLARHQDAGRRRIGRHRRIAGQLPRLSSGRAAPSPTRSRPGTQTAPCRGGRTTAAPAAGKRALELLVGPLRIADQADSLIELFGEIIDLGTIEALDGGQPADGMRRFKIVTASSDNELLDLFTFHVAREHVKLLPLGPGFGFHKGAPVRRRNRPTGDRCRLRLLRRCAWRATAGRLATIRATAAAHRRAAKRQARRRPSRPHAAEAATLRVSVEKVDQLINLVGELVITQAMLAQTSAKVDPVLYQQLAAGLADLERNTRDLQESVMSIRMIPMSVVFSRFPRMLRDLAAKLGKKVEFVTLGEATELDKGLVEKITDPLTHLVRNSCDHGIELPDERAGQGQAGDRHHHAGGLAPGRQHRDRGARRRQGAEPRASCWPRRASAASTRPTACPTATSGSLIFAPGFSTADVVTDVSGRGVGMDVVKKNITALGGTVEIESAEGFGMSVKVRLPLTLAIMDGMSVGVGGECYILPLSSVVESFQVDAEKIKTHRRQRPRGAGARRIPAGGRARTQSSSVPRSDARRRASRSWWWSKPKAAARRCWSTSCWASNRWW